MSDIDELDAFFRPTELSPIGRCWERMRSQFAARDAELAQARATIAGLRADPRDAVALAALLTSCDRATAERVRRETIEECAREAARRPAGYDVAGRIRALAARGPKGK